MAAPRHLKWPLELGPKGSLVTVEQDTNADVANCINVILNYPQGSRLDLPKFGLPGQIGLPGGPNLNDIRQAVLAFEPRADVNVHLTDSIIRAGISRVEVDYATRGRS